MNEFPNELLFFINDSFLIKKLVFSWLFILTPSFLVWTKFITKFSFGIFKFYLYNSGIGQLCNDDFFIKNVSETIFFYEKIKSKILVKELGINWPGIIKKRIERTDVKEKEELIRIIDSSK